MRKIIIIYLFVCSISCIEPFDYKVNDYDQNLVVEAILTNEDKHHQVKLTYTSPINDQEEIFATGAKVNITSSNNETISFEEIEPGIYQTINKVRGQIGIEYKLNINTKEDRVYESSLEKLPESAPITSLYARFENVPSAELNRNEGGIQFFIDTELNNGPGYFRYEWEETYLIVVPYPSELSFNLADCTFVEREEIISRCYQNRYSEGLLIANSNSNELNNIRAFPLHFIGNESESDAPYRLRHRYSLLAKQYNINSSTYEYYRKLKAANESGGSLFDEQQGAITGNINSVTDDGEAVLGNFEVSSVTSKRNFFNPEDFNAPFERPDNLFDCPFGQEIFPPGDSLLYYITTGFYDVYKRTEGFGATLYIGTKNCVRCDHFANPDKPDYWID
ncbi:hypothetical protein GCM10027429_27910 [Marivirga atlantica]|jgi:hypothetical protein|uniref:DUF4249 domain-containing protein n=1 Tax=Marivirga atlantica TaxID=1548457 RepID=A0A937AMS6_9BACT|nr:DUF4249 domain-containing protein [Marivirga atlantica]MBL0766393.1 DUF4249 domain-containing protein [Marivirga atlantica]